MKAERQFRVRGDAGFSLVEMLVVFVIIGIIAGFAFMQRGTTNEQFKRQNVARELKVAFERARFDSVKRRAQASPTDTRAKVIVDATSYTLITDRNQDGDTTDAGDSLTTNFASQNITISSDSTSLPVTVNFDKRGEVTATDDPIFLVCNGTCTFADDTPSTANIVLVTPTGTVNMLNGGATPPTFNAPDVSVVPTNTNIKDIVHVP